MIWCVTKSRIAVSLFTIESIDLTNIYWTHYISGIIRDSRNKYNVFLLWSLNYSLCIWEEGIFVFTQLWGKKFNKQVIPVCLDLPFYHPNLPLLWQFSLFLGIYKETVKKCRYTDYLNYIFINLMVNWQLLRQCDQCLKFNWGIGMSSERS